MVSVPAYYADDPVRLRVTRTDRWESLVSSPLFDTLKELSYSPALTYADGRTEPGQASLTCSVVSMQKPVRLGKRRYRCRVETRQGYGDDGRVNSRETTWLSADLPVTHLRRVEYQRNSNTHEVTRTEERLLELVLK